MKREESSYVITNFNPIFVRYYSSMQLITFILIYPFVWIISRLPMRVLYIISDGFYLLNYYVIGYRKEVVLENLKLAFPKKEEKELKKIRKQFFKHLTDFFLESFKSFTISEKEVLKRMKYKNMEMIEEVVASGKSIMIVGCHQANWEWLLGIPLNIDNIKCQAAYTKIANKYFERVVKKTRSKFGGIMYRSTDTIKNVYRNYKSDTQSLYCLLSDQSPQINKANYWSEFMGVKVPIHTGAEMLAKKYDMAYAVWTSRKIKRGHYEIEFELITTDPKKAANYTLTDRFLDISEKNIRENPEVYLWSHKRFKHRDKVPKEYQ